MNTFEKSSTINPINGVWIELRLTLVVLCALWAPSAKASEAGQALRCIEALFAALSDQDAQALKRQVTSEFVLLEHGEVWNIEDLARVSMESRAIRTHFFSLISITHYEHTAVVNYWNKATFQLADRDDKVVWLESAVLQNVEGRWAVSQMHSTRLDHKGSPEGVTFSRELN